MGGVSKPLRRVSVEPLGKPEHHIASLTTFPAASLVACCSQAVLLLFETRVGTQGSRMKMCLHPTGPLSRDLRDGSS